MANVFSRHESNRARLGCSRKTSSWPPPPPQTLQELERALLEEWDKIPQLVINSLVDSMPQRNEQADKLARSVTESNVYIDWIAPEHINANIFRKRIGKTIENYKTSKYHNTLERYNIHTKRDILNAR
ncbi:hypothetical protein TNCV_5050961 [Trichonephila clavipes]|nr:hypothetical protein TNCV_5050961 [Trichonephila clavipes]